MFLFKILFIGHLLSFSSSNYLDSDSNPHLNSLIEDCRDGQGPEDTCFCHNELENDFEYSNCPEPQDYFYTSVPVNCEWSNWSEWGSCSQSCDGGTQISTRSKTVQESNGGACSGLSEKSQSCNSQSCPGEFSFT